MTDAPTYSMPEVLELIRNARDIPHLILIRNQWIEEKYRYSLYDLAIMDFAAEFIVRMWARDDVRRLKNLMDKWRSR